MSSRMQKKKSLRIKKNHAHVSKNHAPVKTYAWQVVQTVKTDAWQIVRPVKKKSDASINLFFPSNFDLKKKKKAPIL